ncbi:hypothetical protein [Burkholderia sola]|uniref:hypothetical protein n=1 Tax=Burkholderia sola TaxID=2843302 RepID=UPI00338FCC80
MNRRPARVGAIGLDTACGDDHARVIGLLLRIAMCAAVRRAPAIFLFGRRSSVSPAAAFRIFRRVRIFRMTSRFVDLLGVNILFLMECIVDLNCDFELIFVNLNEFGK